MSLIETPIDATAALEADGGPALPPADPAVPPGQWIKQNLFSTAGSSVLSVVFAAVAFFTYWGLINFAFHNPSRKWDAVWSNMRLLMTQSYPVSQYVRVWFSLGIIMALVGLTVGVMRSNAKMRLTSILTKLMAVGGVTIVTALLINNNIQTDPETGEFLRALKISPRSGELEPIGDVLRIGYGEALAGRWWVFLVGGILLFGALAAWVALGDRRRFIFLPFLGVLYGLFGLAVLSLWVIPYGHYIQIEGVSTPTKGVTVARSTQGPWTVMFLLLGIAWLIGRYGLPSTSSLKALMFGLWFLSPYVIIFVVLRDPALDWSHVWSTDVPMFAAFALLGGAMIWFLTKPGLGEIGRVIAALLIALAAFHWLAGFFGWYPMLQKARLSFLVLGLFGLAAPNFAGDKAVRRGFVLMWVGAMVVMHYLITMVNTPSTLENVQSDSFIGGFLMTLTLTVFGLALSFPIGVIFALARTSKLPIFRLLSTLFIEVSRGIPLITVLFFFATIIPLFLPEGMEITKLAAAILALVLFSAAYVAENIRGGLQSVRRGQFEAADAVGLSTAQRIGLIVLPQALRVSIPPLVGQAIATYKETSLIAIIGLFDFLLIADAVILGQVDFRQSRFEPLLFVSLVYWIGAYAMSRYSRSLETRLGVGTR